MRQQHFRLKDHGAGVPLGARCKDRIVALLAVLVLAPAAMAQSIDIPTVAVVKGDTAEIPLTFVAGGGATNFDFIMNYNPAVVDESTLGVICTPNEVGLTNIDCHIDLARNQIKGIGVNLPLSALSTGVFATISLPIFSEAPTGESASDFNANFASASMVDAFDISWTPKVNAAYCNAVLVSGLVTSNEMFEACELLMLDPSFTAQAGSSIMLSSGMDIEFMPGASVEYGATMNAATCGQSLCAVSGNPMPAGCHSCAVQVCDADSSCCDTEWSQACVDQVNTLCGLVCE